MAVESIKSDIPWICWDCDAGDCFLCQGDEIDGIQCACTHGDEYFIAVIQ